MPEVKYDVVRLAGGWDQISPSLSLKPGVARDALNFECAPTGGYARIGGYERYDGLAKPSDASYTYVQVDAFTNVPSVGDTLTGQTSGTTGEIIAVSEASLYMVLTKIAVSTYNGTEAVAVGATPIGTQVAFTATVSSENAAIYQAAAADVYRALIGKVPGSGPVRGIVGLTVSGTDKLYAFRNNAGGTGCDLYVASGSGWTQIAYKREVSFTAGGTATPADGATLTQGAVTATVRRVVTASGAWTGTAAGRFIVDTVAGGAGVFAAGAATLTGGATVTLSGADTAITMAAGGHFEFEEGNFTGAASTIRLYGCDGVNRSFEFDGTTFVPIVSGASSDTPKHIAVHKNHLVLAQGASLIISGPGTPYRFSATDDGTEIATGATITGLLAQPGGQTTGALAVFGAKATSVLYGTGLADWNFAAFNAGTGALHYSGQNMEQSYVFDNQGVISLAASQAYGNFTQATLTASIQTFIADKRSKVACSSVNRVRNQYRVFFSDGYGLYLTIVNGKMRGAMPVFFPTEAFCAYSGVLSTGGEVSYFGDADGYVQQMDVGSSFDGADIDAFITLNWNTMGAPRLLKRFRKASVEMQGSYYAKITFGYQLGYGTTEKGQPAGVEYASGFTSAPNWDSFTWDDFFWDGRTLAPTEIAVNGTAENIQVTLSTTGDYIYPFTINSLITHYSVRRGLR